VRPQAAKLLGRGSLSPGHFGVEFTSDFADIEQDEQTLVQLGDTFNIV